jgi:multicomponent Na+:H+ antiporter subunit D
MGQEWAIVVAVVLPLAGAFGVAATGRWPNLREAITLLSALSTFGVVVGLVAPVMSGARPAFSVLEVLPGVALAFEVEPLGMLYALVASGLWIPTALYSIGYCRGHGEANQTRFFACFAVAIGASLGIAFSRNLFTLFFFYEMLTLCTYPLVTHYGTDEARKAGRTYLGILVATSVGFLLLAILWTWALTGTLEFRPGGILSGNVDGPFVIILLALYVFGTGKAALMPFHRWLPAAMVAPTPVSALLHAVAIVKAGVFTVMKVIVYVFGIEFLAETGASVWLMYVASFTLITAAIIAFTKDNLKARLAYSTVSQLSYIVLGGALATAAGVMGGGMHIAMHAMGKITLFFCAGAILIASHKTKISEMDGIGRVMPFTMVAFGLGSMSIIGLPPMGGTWSKWYLALGAAEGHYFVFVGVLMLSSLLSAGYLIPLVGRAFLFAPDPKGSREDSSELAIDAGPGEEPGFLSNIREAPLLCLVPLCATALGCLVLFFFAPQIYDLLRTMDLG